MIHFEHTEYLWLLGGVAFLGFVWWLTHWGEERRLKRWAKSELLQRMMPDRSSWRPITKAVLTLLGISLVVIALANPLMGRKLEKGKRTGSDIAICIDVSNSMMAEDVTPNRLARSKHVVNNLLNTMTGDRISLVVFAGSSFIEMPLTSDYNAAKLFLEQVDCSMVTAQGTAIGEAIEKAMATFGYGDEEREWTTNNSRAIIVISDGENHEDDAVGAAKEAVSQGIRVCTIGLGSPQGSPIPGKDGNYYRRDREGNVIITRLNEQMLREIAHAGKGVYVNGSGSVSDITNMLESLEKNDFDEAIFNSFESRYQYPLVAGLFLLLAEVFIFERRNKKWRLAFLFVCLFFGNAQGQSSWQGKFNQANSHYRQQLYLKAANQYYGVLKDSTLNDENRQKTLYNLGNCFYKLGHESNDPKALNTATNCYSEALTLQGKSTGAPLAAKIHYNLGNALYLQKKYSDATAQYNDALSNTPVNSQADNLAFRSHTMYNMGNSLLKESLKDHDTSTLQTAISCYRNALRLDPTNDDYRYAQSLAYKLLGKWTKKKPQKNEPQSKKEKKKEEQKQQDKEQQQNDKQQQDRQQQQNKQQQQQQQQQQQKQQQQKQQQQQKELNDEVNRELQRQQEKQSQKDNQKQSKQQQQQQQQQQQNDKKDGKGQKESQQQDKGKNNSQNQQQKQQEQGQNNQNQNQNQNHQDPQQGQKQNHQQKKQGQQQLDNEIKKELERQKEKEKGNTDKDSPKEEKGKNNSEEKNGTPDTRKQDKSDALQGKANQKQSPTGKQQTASAQQGTVVPGNKKNTDKKNAEHVLEAVKNNERSTIKAQIKNAQSIKGQRIEKEW